MVGQVGEMMYSFFNLAAPRGLVASGPSFILVGPVGERMYSFFYLAAPRSLVASGPYFILVGPVEQQLARTDPLTRMLVSASVLLDARTATER